MVNGCVLDSAQPQNIERAFPSSQKGLMDSSLLEGRMRLGELHYDELDHSLRETFLNHGAL